MSTGIITSTPNNVGAYSYVTHQYSSSSEISSNAFYIKRKPRGPYKKDKFTVSIKSGPTPGKQDIVGKVKALDFIGKLLDNMPSDAPYDLEIVKHP